ncbi:hypothetical protein [Budvicia aquatica]|nr:hypothetical protein [Budvicia aquatica]
MRPNRRERFGTALALAPAGEYQDDTSIVGNCQPFCFVCSLSVSVSTE